MYLTLLHQAGFKLQIPHAWPFEGYRKKFLMCGISCHKNMKFLHAIAEVCLYHMHKKKRLRVFGT
jgi:hypothetical protein